MDATQFAEETRRLARPRLVLRQRQQAGEVVGVWGGSGPLPAPAGDWRHRITVSCGWLNRNGFALSGLLGVYENLDEAAFHEFTVVRDERSRTVPSGGDGVELVGAEEVSPPPIEALAVYGGAAMREVVRAVKDGNPQLHLVNSGKAGTPFATYDERCPLFHAEAEGIFATLGGWHVPWPENDAYDEEEGRLVLWTFKDAEPWLEVWQRPSGQLHVMPRIT